MVEPQLTQSSRVERLSIVVPEDADGFLGVHPRMCGAFHRRDRGVGPTKVESVDSGVVRTTWNQFGFSVAGELELGVDFIGCGMIVTGDGPIRWHGSQGAAGEAFLFPSGSWIPASFPAGTSILSVSAPMSACQSAADDLGYSLTEVSPRLTSGPATRPLLQASRPHQEGPSPEAWLVDEILRALVRLCSADAVVEEGARSRITSAQVVSEVTEFLKSEGLWKMSTLQMCRVSHVSERRLQLAFHEVFGVPPSTFLRERALSAVRDRLLASDPSETRVSDVALDHGFHHLSRFSAIYRDAFGELPSRTLSQPSPV